MKINWKVRAGNKTFWFLFIPALAAVITSVCQIFGLDVQLGDLVKKILECVTAAFALLGVLGVVVDPTTEGLEDSDRAMSYKEPWHDFEEEETD